MNRELMFNLPMEKKWELYLSKQKVSTGDGNSSKGWLVLPAIKLTDIVVKMLNYISEFLLKLAIDTANSLEMTLRQLI